MSRLTPEIERAFDAVSYLRGLDAVERTLLAEHCAFRSLPAGATLFREDDEAAGIFLILEGRIKVVRSSDEGREQVLHEEGVGVTLAEAPVFGGGGYVGSAIAVDAARIFFVPRRPLLAALNRSPGSATEVIRILAGRVRKLAAMVEDLSLRDVTERTAGYLIREMDRLGTRAFELPPTREQFAAHLGTVREQVSRALSHLKATGLIEIDGRRVCLLDPDRIRQIARVALPPDAR